MTSNLPDLRAATTLRLSSWRIVGTTGHAADSPYVERFWLPILGPSTTLLIRHLDRKLTEAGEQIDVDLCDIGHSLGLGERVGRHAPLLRSFRRAADYDMVMAATNTHPEEDVTPAVQILLVRRSFPPLSSRLVARLAPALAREHYASCASSAVAISSAARRTVATSSLPRAVGG